MTRPVKDVLFEATIIGILNIAIYYLLRRISKKSTTTLLLFISGFMIHMLFEYLGANEWWCRQTYRMGP
jgi:hypothetical protein